MRYGEVQIIAIHLGTLSIEKVVRFLSGLSGHPEKIVISSTKVKKTYGIIGFPYSVVIDSNNRVYKIIPGYNKQSHFMCMPKIRISYSCRAFKKLRPV